MDEQVHVIVLGCKLNQAEVLEKQLSSGWQETSFEEASTVWIHTCAVTAEAERKSRKAIRKSLAHGKKVVVSGCLATIAKEKLQELGVQKVIGHDTRSFFSFPALPASRPYKPRVFLKIQDGCIRHCAFCIVPHTRPVLFSRSPDDILREIREWEKAGAKEVVLTGASLGLYGLPERKPEEALPELLYRIAEETEIPRLRLTSLDPRDFSPALFSCFQRIPQLCPHLHLSLQSGDDGILKAMRRGYTLGEYRAICEKLREMNSSFSLTTDILVGFPGETVQAFENTLQAMKLLGFSRAHIFPYAPRPGTASYSFPDTPSQEKKRRVKEALALAAELERAYATGFLQKEQEVLIETQEKNWSSGYSPYYLYMLFSEPLLPGSIVRAKGLFYLPYIDFHKSGGIYARVCAH